MDREYLWVPDSYSNGILKAAGILKRLVAADLRTRSAKLALFYPSPALLLFCLLHYADSKELEVEEECKAEQVKQPVAA